MKAEILDRLAAAGSLDAFYFDVHGAMAVEGLDDAEADLLAALRARLPAGLPVTCGQDLHGNLSPALVRGWIDDPRLPHRAPCGMCWRPGRGWCGCCCAGTGKRVRSTGPGWASRCWSPGRCRARRASRTIPLRPARAGVGREDGVWDASLWIGYAWADQPRARAAATACGTYPEAVKAAAEAIARRVWAARGDFRFGSPAGTAAACLDEAVSLGGMGVFL